MQYLRIILGVALVLVVILYLTRPAEPTSGLNRVSYDGTVLELNGRSIDPGVLVETDFPDDATVQIDLTDIGQTTLGAKSALLQHWNEKGVDYYHSVYGVPALTSQLTWRKATLEELRAEIEEQNDLRRAQEAARQAKKASEEAHLRYMAKPEQEMISDRSPPPEPVADEITFTEYVPTDKNRYLWNEEEAMTADQLEKFLGALSLTSPGALMVLAPKYDAPPENAQNIDDLGFPPVVAGAMTRARDRGLVVSVHHGPGQKPTGGSRSAAGMFGGLFFAYLGPILIMLVGVFIVSWIMDGGRANRES